MVSGSFFHIRPVLLPSAPNELPRIRVPPLPAPKMETFVPKGNICGLFYHSLFCKSPFRLKLKPCTRFYVTTLRITIIADLLSLRLPKDFLAASAALKAILRNLSGKNLFPSVGNNTLRPSITFYVLKTSARSRRQILPINSQNLTAMRQNLPT